MVYENTHLWAADAVRKQIKNSVLKEIITTHIDHYHLGAVFPDTLYYSNDKKIRDIADFLHGNTGSPANQVVFDVLDRAKGTYDEKNLAFICGYLTHMAMDIVFHPIVFYFSGYKPESSPKEKAKSSYLHWHYETCIDKRFNDKFFLDRAIKPAVVKDLVVAPILNISKQIILESLGKQISYFRRTHSRLFYIVYRMLVKIGLVERKYIAGFYTNLDVDRTRLPEKLQYKDIISGETREATLDGLMDQGIKMGVKTVESAYDYYCGKIIRQLCKSIVVGNNLDTGQIGKTKSDVRFSIDS